MIDRTYTNQYVFKGHDEDGMAIYEFDGPEEVLYPIPSREEWEHSRGKGA